MVRKHRNLPAKIAAIVAAPVIAVGLFAGSASAAVTCDSATFTTNGEFDLDGYLACLAGSGGTTAPGGGGALPTTGSDTMRLLSMGLGLGVVGAGALVASKRGNAARPDPA